MNYEKLRKVEPYFFILCVLGGLFPLFLGLFYPSIDGPAHLYNTQLITDLITGTSPEIEEFFSFNPHLVPNWTGHFLLAIFKLVLPSYIADKLLLTIILVGFPLSFRGLIRLSSRKNEYWVSYLIFPMVYSFMLIVGFYNFCLALVFLFLTLRFWITNEKKSFGYRSYISLFILITLTYFSHVLVFVILLMLMFSYSLIQAVHHRRSEHLSFNEVIRSLMRKAKVLFISSGATLILFLHHLSIKTYSKDYIYLPFHELVSNIFEFRPLVGYGLENEAKVTVQFAWLIGAILALRIILYFRLLMLKKRLIPTCSINLMSSFWLLTIGILSGMYFLAPDSDGSAGYVSLRLLFFLYLFLLLWISTQKFPKWLGIPIVLVVVYINFIGYMPEYIKVTQELSEIAEDCYNASEFIDEGEVVLPLDYSNNWMLKHFSNYLGADKSIVILENYEANTTYFPLKWNKSELPNLTISGLGLENLTCTKWRFNNKNRKKEVKVEYVFIIGENLLARDSCRLQISDLIAKHFELAYTSKYSKLYKSRAYEN